MPQCEGCGDLLVGHDYEKIARIKHKMSLCARCYLNLKYSNPSAQEQIDSALLRQSKEHEADTALLRQNVKELHEMHQKALMERDKFLNEKLDLEDSIAANPSVPMFEVSVNLLIGNLVEAGWHLTDSDHQSNGLAIDIAQANERYSELLAGMARLEILMATLNGGLAEQSTVPVASGTSARPTTEGAA